MSYILPVLFILLFVYCIIKKVPAYDYFAEGAKEAISLVFSIFPYLCAIFIFVEILNASGVSKILCDILAPVLNFLKIPSALSELLLLRPFSGNGSLAILDNIYSEFGVDSYEGKCASVLVGASDTIFYVIAVYFSTVKIKKLSFILPVCLLASLLGSICSCYLVKLFMF